MEKCLAELRCDLCSCSYTDDCLDAEANTELTPHIETYYWILHYTTLNSEPGRRLCRVGKCQKCGKLFCEGLDIPAKNAGDDFIREVYICFFLEAYSMKQEFLNNGVFHEEFMKLFHENDRPAVKAWLKLP